MKLVRELAEGASGRLLVLDEPTVGLHASEVRRLVDLLQQIVACGNTVLVIEHHVDVLAACDWLIELGPGGGEHGGTVIAEGPPESVARSKRSCIAPFLSPSLARRYSRAAPAGNAPDLKGSAT
jgi:excinuclease ABC subunit A